MMEGNKQNFSFDIDLLQALLWQYNDAERLQSLLTAKSTWYNTNTEQFWREWYEKAYTLDTADAFGLALWALILNTNFVNIEPLRESDSVFGFEPFAQNFFESNFQPQGAGGAQFLLTTEQRKLILQARYLKCISMGTVPQVNRVLQILFGKGAFIIDHGDMSSQMIVFSQYAKVDVEFILQNFSVFPTPSTIGLFSRTVSGDEFGFAPHGNNFFDAFFAPLDKISTLPQR